MSFDVIANPKTREYAVLRRPARAGGGADAATVADMYAPPGAAVAHEHRHPCLTESFTVVRGRLGMIMAGRRDEIGPGTRVTVPPGVPHAWWSVGEDTAWVVVEVDPGARFELMMRNMSFLAADGRTDDRGRPSWLQTALSGLEFDDIMQIVSPPPALQRVLFRVLAPVARLRGLRSVYPDYADRVTERLDEVETLPPEIVALLPAGVPVGTSDQPPAAVRRAS